MAFFPQIGPFYDPDKEQEIYTDSEGRLKSRIHTNPKHRRVIRHPSDISVSSRGNRSTEHVTRKTRQNALPERNSRPRQAGLRDNSNHKNGYDANNRSANLPFTENIVPSELNPESALNQDSFDSLDITPFLVQSTDETSHHANNIYQSASPLSHASKAKIFTLGEIPDFMNELDDPLNAHFENTGSLYPDESFFETNNNDFNAKFRGSDHSSCSYGSEYSQSARSNHRKPERNKHIFLMPQVSDSKKFDTSGISLCEQLFGIILCQYNHRPGQDSTTIRRSPALRERKIIVQDVVQGSPAEYSGKIHRGDMLISVNDIQVSWMNLGTVFRALSHRQEAKLIVRSPVIIGTPPHPSKSGSNLYRRLTNTSIKQGEKTLNDFTYGALFLTLETASSQGDKEQGDILYQYPCNNSALQAIRGLFITLAYSLVDVTGKNAKSSSLLLKDQLIHVCYIVQGKDVLVIALPAKRISLVGLNVVQKEISQLLNFMFGSIKSAFQQSESDRMDQLFALTFRRLLTPDGSQGCGVMMSRFFDTEAEMRMLKMSDDNKLICDEILSEFEAMDFDEFLPDEKLESRRNFSVLGCILFYKNFLLASHLSQEDQSDINLFLKHHALYHIMGSKSLDNLVMWQEIFPTSRCQQPVVSPPGYMEPRGRWFLLIVGMNNYLLCTILEAGGIAQQADGIPRVDPFFVDQMKATIEQLEEEDVNMSMYCEERISCEESNISLARVEKFLPKTKTKEDNVSPQKIPPSPKTPVSGMKSDSSKYKYSPNSDKCSNASEDKSEFVENTHVNMKRQGSKLSYGSNESTGSSNSAGPQRTGILSKAGRFTSAVDISAIGRSLSVVHLDNLTETDIDDNKLTRGRSNVLFNYVQLEESEGVIICPTSQLLFTYQSSISTQLINSMYHCCSNIRKLFQEDRHNQNLEERGRSNVKSNTSVPDIQEHGVLFHMPASIQPPSTSNKRVTNSSLAYWVVGKRLSVEGNYKELYVCFHESVPQSVVEMAFSLGFGS